MKKIYTDIDLLKNEIKNLVIGNQTSPNLTKNGELVYDTTNDQILVRIDGETKKLGTGNSFNKFVIKSSELGDGELVPTIAEDTLIFEEGENIQFEYDEIERSVTINASVDYFAENYYEDFGNDSDLTYTITHNLDTENIIVSVLVNEGESIHPDFQVIRYLVLNENSISIIVNVAPGDDAVKAVISSKHGQKGDMGFQGVVGPIGVQGFQGPNPTTENLVFDEEDNNKTLKIINETLTPTDDIFIEESLITLNKNSKFTKNVEIDQSLNNSIPFIIRNTTSGAQSIFPAIQVLEQINTGVQSEIFKINSDGSMRSEKVKKDLDPIPEQYPVGNQFYMFGDTSGHIGVSKISIDNTTAIREKRGTLTSSQILNSYDIPITLLENTEGGSLLDIHSIFLFYSLGNSPYIWNNTSVFQIAGSNKNIGTLNLNLVNGTKHGYQKIVPSFSDNSLDMYVSINNHLIFKTLTANPTSGTGTIKYVIKYSNIKF